MKYGVLLVLAVYYLMMSAVAVVSLGTDVNIELSGGEGLNMSDYAESDLDTGGLFGTGVSFVRFLGFVTFGVGLPSDTPGWFMFMFGLWQTFITIASVGFIISSIWDG